MDLDNENVAPSVQEEPVVADISVTEAVEEPVITAVAVEEEPVAEVVEEQVTPKIVFIVPYRDREEHLKVFSSHMQTLLQKYPKNYYKIHYIHQCDNRPFNRGAMKNIGFLMIKNKYPNTYKNITFVFNDIDTIPKTPSTISNYETKPGVIKHFYGFRNALGGIVSINASDFEKIAGFPNFWAWGYEDNLLQIRILYNKMEINRDIFYDIKKNTKDIIRLKEDNIRDINKGEYDRFLQNTSEGIHSIKDLEYTIDESNGFVNVTMFSTDKSPNDIVNKPYNVKDGNRPFDKKIGLMYAGRQRIGGFMRMNI